MDPIPIRKLEPHWLLASSWPRPHEARGVLEDAVRMLRVTNLVTDEDNHGT